MPPCEEAAAARNAPRPFRRAGAFPRSPSTAAVSGLRRHRAADGAGGHEGLGVEGLERGRPSCPQRCAGLTPRGSAGPPRSAAQGTREHTGGHGHAHVRWRGSSHIGTTGPPSSGAAHPDGEENAALWEPGRGNRGGTPRGHARLPGCLRCQAGGGSRCGGLELPRSGGAPRSAKPAQRRGGGGAQGPAPTAAAGGWVGAEPRLAMPR